jgi:hypothetical protein
MNYNYRIFHIEKKGFFVEEKIGEIATCDHSLIELKNFHEFHYEEDELTEHAQSSMRAYQYVFKNHPELLL